MWMAKLDRTERHTMTGCFLGWTLDSLDVQVYSFVVPTLLAIWHLSSTQAGLIGTAALLSSAIGGWLAGIAADRFGRVRVLQVTVVWYALFTFLCGFAQDYHQMLIARAMQGFGFGGEWATGAVLIGEVVRPAYRGRAVGLVQSGWAVGWGLAAVLYGLFFSFMPEEIAWRSLFWIGLAPALLALWVRRHVPESAEFVRQRDASTPASLLQRVGAIFQPAHIGVTAKLSLLAVGSIGASYTFLIWLPTFLKKVRGLSVIGTTGYTFVMIAGAFVGFLLGAWLADAIGRRRTLALSAVGSAVLLGLYMLVPFDNHTMLVLGFPLGLCAFMMFSPMGPYMTELYPTSVRATGQGFCYNFGRGIGALFPALVGSLIAKIGMAEAIAFFGIGAYALMLVAVWLLPETVGRALPDEAAGADAAGGLDALPRAPLQTGASAIAP
jgi:MFS family permease